MSSVLINTHLHRYKLVEVISGLSKTSLWSFVYRLNLVTNASVPNMSSGRLPAAGCNGREVGKWRERVSPVIRTPPVLSTAMAWPSSNPSPPR